MVIFEAKNFPIPPMQFPPIAIQFATKKIISQQNENK